MPARFYAETIRDPRAAPVSVAMRRDRIAWAANNRKPAAILLPLRWPEVSFRVLLVVSDDAAKRARMRRNARDLGGDPGGIRTRDLNLERVASWARLDDGVSERSIPDRSRPVVSDERFCRPSERGSGRRARRRSHLHHVADPVAGRVGRHDLDRPARSLDDECTARVDAQDAAGGHRVITGLTRG
jgi:hypothetical protein